MAYIVDKRPKFSFFIYSGMARKKVPTSTPDAAPTVVPSFSLVSRCPIRSAWVTSATAIKRKGDLSVAGAAVAAFNIQEH